MMAESSKTVRLELVRSPIGATERQRAAVERQRAEAAEAELTRLRQELESLRGGPPPA